MLILLILCPATPCHTRQSSGCCQDRLHIQDGRFVLACNAITAHCGGITLPCTVQSLQSRCTATLEMPWLFDRLNHALQHLHQLKRLNFRFRMWPSTESMAHTCAITEPIDSKSHSLPGSSNAPWTISTASFCPDPRTVPPLTPRLPLTGCVNSVDDGAKDLADGCGIEERKRPAAGSIQEIAGGGDA